MLAVLSAAAHVFCCSYFRESACIQHRCVIICIYIYMYIRFTTCYWNKHSLWAHKYIYIYIYYQQMYIHIYIYRHNISIYIYIYICLLHVYTCSNETYHFNLLPLFTQKHLQPRSCLAISRGWTESSCGTIVVVLPKKRRDHSLLRNKVFNCQKQTCHVYKFLSIKYIVYIYICYVYIKKWHQTLVTSKQLRGMGLQMASNFRMSGLSSTTSSNKPPWSLRHGVSLALEVSLERLRVGSHHSCGSCFRFFKDLWSLKNHLG